MSVDTRFHISLGAVPPAAAIGIKMLPLYQQGKKANSQQIQSRVTQYLVLSCMCCRDCIHCTIASALGIAA